MHRAPLVALAAALVSSGSQALPNSTLALAFGNTVVSTYADGRHQYLWLKADGGWTGIARDGKTLAGEWSLAKDGRVCLRQRHPPTLPFAYCTRLPQSGAVGASWPARDVLGRSITLSLVAGIQKPAQSGGSQEPSAVAAPR